MPLSRALGQWLQSEGHDAIHASDIHLDRATDTEILARASLDKRTVVTADLDYPRLLALASASEPSLILSREGDWSEAEVIDRMREVLDRLSESEIAQSILVVERGRLRRRLLPITQI